MTQALLVGVDVGTTRCKAVVLTTDGVERSFGVHATPWTRVATGAEADPGALLSAALAAVRQALDAGPPGRVAGVGVTSMAETGVLLDGAGRPLLPAIAWNDRRGEEDGRALAADLGAREVARRTGLATGPTVTAVKYRWMRRNRPETRAGRLWLSVAEWIVHALGGAAVAEAPLASRTGWLDLDRLDWWPEALAWSGIDRSLLPDVRQAGDPAGSVRAGFDGLAGAVLTVAGHDHQSAAVGAGATGVDDVLDSCGTAEAFLRAVVAPVGATVRERAVASGLNVGWNVLPRRMVVLGGFRSGDRLRRLLDALGVDDREPLEAEACAVEGPFSALSVEDLDRIADGTGPRPDRASIPRLWREAVEAVARHGAGVLERLEDLTGPRRRLVVVGGWTRSGSLAAAKEALLGPLVRPSVREAGARGAALLSGVAAGVYADVAAVPPPPAASACRPRARR